MARRSTVRRVEEFILFDVLYEDGTRTSNRKIPGSELGELNTDLLAKTYIEAQDRQIAEISGNPGPQSRLSPACVAAEARGPPPTSAPGAGSNPRQLCVRENDVDTAIRVLKK